MCRVGMGRVGYVPSLLCAEFAMCRVDPAPKFCVFIINFLHSVYNDGIVKSIQLGECP